MRTAHSWRIACAATGLAGSVALSSTAAFAHHSFAAFDMDNKVTIEGDVAEVQWTNPHTWIEVNVPNENGEIERWGVEFNSPNNLTRQGWRRDTIQAGDHVTFVISPMRDGRLGGLFYEVTLSDGRLIQDPSAAAASRRAAAAAETEAAPGGAPQ